MVAGVDVDAHLFHQIPDGRQPAVGHVPVGVRFEAFAVADARRRVQRPDAGAARLGRRQPRRVGRGVGGGLDGAARPGRPRGHVRIRAVRPEQLHRLDVGRIGGAPEGRRPVDTLRAAVVVRHVPQVLLEPRVRVGPGVEQRPHDVKVGGLLLVVRAGLRIARPRRPLQVQRGEQRRGPGVGGDAGVGAAPDEPQGEVEVAVHDGDLQRAGTVAAGPIDVGAGAQQGHRHLGMTLPGRVQQGGQPALHTHPFGVVARRAALDPRGVAALRRNVAESLHGPRGPHRRLHLAGRGPPPLPVAGRRRRAEPVQHLLAPPGGGAVHGVEVGQVDHLRGDFEVRAALHQHVHRPEPVGGGGEHQGRLPPGALADVHVGPVVEKGRDGLGVPRLRGEMQRRRPARRAGVRVGTGFQQRPHNRHPAAPPRDVQRRMATEASRRLKMSAGVEQHLGQLAVAPHRRPMQRGHAVGPGRLHVGAPFEQGPHGRRVAAARRIRDRRVDRGCQSPRGRVRHGQHGRDRADVQ